MSKKNLTHITEIRRRAEEHLASHPPLAAAQPEENMQRLVHELQVHQVELAMQNEELLQSRAQVETELQRYSDLYDFAPVGYLLLDRRGSILQANLTSANLLAMNRVDLIGRRLGLFLDDVSWIVFNTFLTHLFADGSKQLCEVALSQKHTHSTCRYVRLEGSLSANAQCHLTMLDITERKRAEQTERESGLRLANIAGLTPAAYWEWNIQTGETVFNEMWARIIGYTLAELAPVSIKTWETYTHPDDLEKSNALLEQYFTEKLPYYGLGSS